jgi:hypothetical protein
MNSFVMGGGEAANPVQVTYCKRGLDAALPSCVMEEGISRHYRRPQLEGSSATKAWEKGACIRCLLSFIADSAAGAQRLALSWPPSPPPACPEFERPSFVQQNPKRQMAEETMMDLDRKETKLFKDGK